MLEVTNHLFLQPLSSRDFSNNKTTIRIELQRFLNSTINMLHPNDDSFHSLELIFFEDAGLGWIVSSA